MIPYITPRLARHAFLLGCTLAVCACLARPTAAQQRAASSPGYRMPPKAIAELIDAPVTPSASLSPNREWLLFLEIPSLPPISEVSQPEMRLAGLRFNPRTNGRSPLFYFKKLTLERIADGSRRDITGLPADLRVTDVTWSPDSERVAFAVTREAATELWVAEIATGKTRRLTAARLSSAYSDSISWLPDSRTLICTLVPSSRGPEPAAPRVPSGPSIQESAGKKAAARTYPDLLRNAADEALFEHYLTCQVARVTLRGEVTPIGSPGIIRRAEPAPGGKYLLVETVHRPFSYQVPVFRFPYRVEVWDLDGKRVRQITDRPLAVEVPIAFDSVVAGPRGFGWRADVPATLHWTEAQDGGDSRVKAEVRDRVFLLPAPFDGRPNPLASLGLRFAGIEWGSDHLALVSEDWFQTRRTRTWVVQPGIPDAPPRVLFDRSSEDRYGDPGTPLLRRTASGTVVLLTPGEGKTLFLSGAGASPEGNRPFLDRLDVETRKTERLWRSEAPSYEQPVQLLDDAGRHLITRRESKSEPPNFFVRDLGAGAVREPPLPRPLTDFPHPTPQLAGVQKELIRYERADGLKLTATLYLPPGYSPSNGPLPMLMWAYPREFQSADAASQVSDSPYRFVRVSPASPLAWLLHGYAVLDNPAMPIVGEGGKEPNDSYVEQLVADARAAVEEVVRRGVADRDRIAIGGHSYGAFMTANLLAHSDLFRAGIARSGAYNRTLTPFGFQAEQRTLWEAPEIYSRMSPFMAADKIKDPILLIHGEADNNPGTFPIQSERFFSALQGNGATVRLVLLPYESHSYRARESVLHMAWEMTEWLDRHVKNAPARKRTEPVAAGR